MEYPEGRRLKHVGIRLYPCRILTNPHVTGTAGAGSLILEFATLGRLTKDERFEKAAYKAFFALWNRKSDVGLVGNTINTFTGVCSAQSSSSSLVLTVIL